MRKAKILLTIVLCVFISTFFIGCAKSIFPDHRGEEGFVDEDTYVHSGVAYREYEDNYAVVEVDPTYTTVEILPEIDGKPVNSINNIYPHSFLSFEGSLGNLCSIVIPPSIKNISDGAFEFSTKLVEVCNLSSLNIEIGSEENGFAGYYAKDIYTTRNYVSKIHIDENGFILYENETDVVLLGYKGEEKDLVIPENVTEIRGVIGSGFDSLEITIDIVKDNTHLKLFGIDIEIGEQPYDYEQYVSIIIESAIVNLDPLASTIYADYYYKEHNDTENFQPFNLYLDTLETVKSYYLLGELFCQIGNLYIDSSIVISEDYLSFTILSDDDDDGEKEVHRIEYMVYETKEYNGRLYNRYVYKYDDELQVLPEDLYAQWLLEQQEEQE